MITLWGRNNSTNVKKVLWTLEELDLPFKQVMAGPEFGVNKDADYPAMNPNGLVPLLRDDETDATLWESNTIVRYLAAQYGRGRLWVENPAQRAQGEKWMDWANQTLSPTHRVILMGLIRTPEADRDYPAIHAARDACESLFAMMDDELAKHTGSPATRSAWAISPSPLSSGTSLTWVSAGPRALTFSAGSSSSASARRIVTW